jgi:large subunit ribosomal protein L17
MASSLIKHKRISTTLAKAKALRVYVEPLITKAKNDTTHSRRTVFSYLQDKAAVTELFREISSRIMDRPGGYTRILKTGFRQGDAAETCIIELVDYNENMLTNNAEKAKSTIRRSRRGGKKTTAAIHAGGETVKPVETEEKTEVETEIQAEAEAGITEETAQTSESESESESDNAPEKEN